MGQVHPQYADWLLAERAQHVARGRWSHVWEIDRQLKKLGRTPPPDSPAPPGPAPLERADHRPPENVVEPSPQPRTEQPGPDVHACVVCDRTFATAAGLGSHARTHR